MIKVFGIGFHKTGTTTLGGCLRHLGYKHLRYNPSLLKQVAGGEIEPVLNVALQYESFDDWPWPLIYSELDEAFPESKFVLTIRKNSDVWFNSLLSHVARRGVTDVYPLVYNLPEPEAHKQAFIERYEAHNQNVKDYFANRPDKLQIICWENGDGWPELCSFLNLPVIEEPLPHLQKKPDSLREWQQYVWPRFSRKMKRPIKQFRQRILTSKLVKWKR